MVKIKTMATSPKPAIIPVPRSIIPDSDEDEDPTTTPPALLSLSPEAAEAKLTSLSSLESASRTVKARMVSQFFRRWIF